MPKQNKKLIQFAFEAFLRPTSNRKSRTWKAERKIRVRVRVRFSLFSNYLSIDLIVCGLIIEWSLHPQTTTLVLKHPFMVVL